MNNTVDRVRKILMEHLGVQEIQVQEGATTFEELGADSLDSVEIAMAVEEEFEIDLPDEEYEKVKSIDDLVAMIEEKEAE